MKGLIDVIQGKDGTVILNSNFSSVLTGFCEFLKSIRTDKKFDVEPDDIRGGFSVRLTNEEVNPVIDENTSDGFHTFKELYHYRMLYNAAFFNELVKSGQCRVVKSRRHSDGELCFGGGWFIVTADLPTGQVSNHYEEKDWDYFHVPVAHVAPKWDGHTPKQAAERLANFVNYNCIADEEFWNG